jgi:hypothetical protein
MNLSWLHPRGLSSCLASTALLLLCSALANMCCYVLQRQLVVVNLTAETGTSLHSFVTHQWLLPQMLGFYSFAT